MFPHHFIRCSPCNLSPHSIKMNHRPYHFSSVNGRNSFVDFVQSVVFCGEFVDRQFALHIQIDVLRHVNHCPYIAQQTTLKGLAEQELKREQAEHIGHRGCPTKTHVPAL